MLITQSQLKCRKPQFSGRNNFNRFHNCFLLKNVGFLSKPEVLLKILPDMIKDPKEIIKINEGSVATLFHSLVPYQQCFANGQALFVEMKAILIRKATVEKTYVQI